MATKRAPSKSSRRGKINELEESAANEKRSHPGRGGYDATVRWAVIAALLAGQAPNAVAVDFGMSPDTVKRWKDNLRDEVQKLPEEHRTEISINLFITIVKSQKAIQAQLDVFSDGEWLRKQTADGVALLHGIIHDKQLRLLEALSSATGANESDDPEGASVTANLH